MTELDKHARIARLLAGSWTNSLTGDERAELEAWRDASEHNRALYHKITSEEFLAGKLEREKDVDHVAGWLAVNARRDARRRARVVRAISAAAVVAGLAFGLLYLADERREETPALVAAIPPGEWKAELVLPDGIVLQLDAERGVPDFIAAPPAGVTARDTGHHLLRTPRGGEYTVTLPDGTTVYLNSESRLRFPARFDARERRVSFSGEAYFEVARDASSPFLVELEGGVIEVLGTRFNVRARGDEPDTRTTLVEGSVRFAGRDEEVILAAGEQGVLDRAGHLEKRAVDVELYTGWKDGYFAFDRCRLEEVARDLARWYKIEVIFDDPAAREISFTGIVKRYGDFNTIIRMLEMTGDTKFVVEGNTIRIRR
jgi:ferric-dicitrate binding protein FerR (iron transport regulator)